MSYSFVNDDRFLSIIASADETDGPKCQTRKQTKAREIRLVGMSTLEGGTYERKAGEPWDDTSPVTVFPEAIYLTRTIAEQLVVGLAVVLAIHPLL